MFQIKQSEATAARRRIPVLLVDLTDGYTPETGVVTPTINISKNGATVASGAGTWTEIGNGQYYYELTTGECDTLGWISVNIEKATVTRDYNAVCQIMAYDYAVGTNLGLSALPTASPNAANGIITFGTGTGQLDVVGGRADADVLYINGAAVNTANAQIGVNVVSMASGAVASIWNALTSGLTTVGSIGKLLVDNVNATISSRSTLTAANVWDYLTSAATTVGSLGKLIVDNLNATISSRSTLTAANVWDQLESNITTASSIGVKLKTNLDTTVSSRSTLTAANVWSETLPGTYTSTQAGFKLNAAGSAADPWSTALPGSYVAGSAGYIIGNNLNATVGSRMATFTLPTNFSLLSISGTGAVTVGTNNDKTGYSLSGTQSFNLTGSITGNLSGSVGSISNPASIWDHLASNVTTTNSIGLQLKTNIDTTISSRLASASYTTPPTAGVIADAVWDEAQNQHTLGGSFGKQIDLLKKANYTVESQITNNITPAADTFSVADTSATNYFVEQVIVFTTGALAGQARSIKSWTNNTTYSTVVVEEPFSSAPANGAEFVITAQHVHTKAEIAETNWNTVRATSSPSGGIPAAGTYGRYLDAQVSSAGGASALTTIVNGPYKLKVENQDQNNYIDLLVGATGDIQLQTLSDDDSIVVLSAGNTNQVKIYNSAGTLVETLSATINYGPSGLATISITTATTNTAGTYNLYLEVTDINSKIVKFGPIKIKVRAL